MADRVREELLMEFMLPGRSPRKARKTDSLSEPLSAREHEVLALIARGKTNPQIAEALTIANATASRHVHNILAKLGMSRRSEAAAYALREGLVE